MALLVTKGSRENEEEGKRLCSIRERQRWRLEPLPEGSPSQQGRSQVRENRTTSDRLNAQRTGSCSP